MEVDEILIDEAVRGIDEAGPGQGDLDSVSWFAARQPGIVRYLAARCGEDSDAMALALWYSCAIYASYERAVGVPPPRVIASLLRRAEEAFVAEALSPGQVADGLAQRQPALSALVARIVERPPVPIDSREAARVGMALAAVIYALDEASWGRQVP